MQPIPSGNYMAYDRAIIVFSPDGRLLQVEYAREAVKRGSTSVGIILKDAVVLGSVKTTAPLGVSDSYKKVYEIDTHAGIVCSGLLGDARDLVEASRVKAQINKITYGEPISVSSLTKYVSDRKHMVTQYGGVRPYGVGLLIGGVNGKAELYETDPSGTMIEWKAQAIGRGADKSRKVLETGYKDNMDVASGVKLLLKAIKAGEKEISDENLEIAVIRADKFDRLSPEDIKKYA
ncbi:MAG: archaeal proteasome endopeptidase complex subunit alpha [Candidatus Aenigmarchaeota archaeon]|nr:archaeal proteasome endopeptidase complex subunit alpha [Candidatus Aenigmarchaeota archaeon]